MDMSIGYRTKKELNEFEIKETHNTDIKNNDEDRLQIIDDFLKPITQGRIIIKPKIKSKLMMRCTNTIN